MCIRDRHSIIIILISNFKLWKSVKNTIYNFFTLFLLQYHCNNVFYHFQKSEWKNIFSFPPKIEKPRKPQNSRENREYRENWASDHFSNPEFGINDQKWFRIHLQTYWDPQLIIFCCTVFSSKLYSNKTWKYVFKSLEN